MSPRLDPIAPGEILFEDFMRPLGISQNRLARDLDVPVARINDIIHASRSITADTALRLAEYFNTSAEFWLNLQSRYELKLASRRHRKPVAALVVHAGNRAVGASGAAAESTGKKVSSAAAKVLKDKTASKKGKAVAASALTQKVKK